MTISIRSIIRFGSAQSPVESYQLADEKLISGNPKQQLQNHYSSPCNQFHSGIWQSESGAWKSTTLNMSIVKFSKEPV